MTVNMISMSLSYLFSPNKKKGGAFQNDAQHAINEQSCSTSIKLALLVESNPTKQ
jgi:hypothetical protein